MYDILENNLYSFHAVVQGKNLDKNFNVLSEEFIEKEIWNANRHYRDCHFLEEMMNLFDGIDYLTKIMMKNYYILVYWDQKSYDAYEIVTGIKIPLYFFDEKYMINLYGKDDFKFEMNGKVHNTKNLKRRFYKHQYMGIIEGAGYRYCEDPAIKFKALDLESQDDLDKLELYLSIHSDVDEFDCELINILDESKRVKTETKARAIEIVYSVLKEKNQKLKQFKSLVKR